MEQTHQKKIRITYHAVIQFLERVGQVDIEGYKDQLRASPHYEGAISDWDVYNWLQATSKLHGLQKVHDMILPPKARTILETIGGGEIPITDSTGRTLFKIRAKNLTVLTVYK